MALLASGDGAELVYRGRLELVSKPLPPLERILSSHPLLHAAEGQLSRDAVATAADMEGLSVTHATPEQAVDAAIAGMGRAAGPPWAADQRHAAAAAWVALS